MQFASRPQYLLDVSLDPRLNKNCGNHHNRPRKGINHGIATVGPGEDGDVAGRASSNLSHRNASDADLAQAATSLELAIRLASPGARSVTEIDTIRVIHWNSYLDLPSKTFWRGEF